MKLPGIVGWARAAARMSLLHLICEGDEQVNVSPTQMVDDRGVLGTREQYAQDVEFDRVRDGESE